MQERSGGKELARNIRREIYVLAWNINLLEHIGESNLFEHQIYKGSSRMSLANMLTYIGVSYKYHTCLMRTLIEVIKIQRSATSWSTWWSLWRRRLPSKSVGWCSIVLSVVDLLLADLGLLCGVWWRSSKKSHIGPRISEIILDLIVTTHPHGSLHRHIYTWLWRAMKHKLLDDTPHVAVGFENKQK
jgi:hypothetical protein